MKYEKALRVIADQIISHRKSAAELEATHMGFDCQFDDPKAEYCHMQDTQTANQLELAAYSIGEDEGDWVNKTVHDEYWSQRF